MTFCDKIQVVFWVFIHGGVIAQFMEFLPNLRVLPTTSFEVSQAGKLDGIIEFARALEKVGAVTRLTKCCRELFGMLPLSRNQLWVCDRWPPQFLLCGFLWRRRISRLLWVMPHCRDWMFRRWHVVVVILGAFVSVPWQE